VTFIPAKGWHLEMMQLSDLVREILGKYPSADVIEGLGMCGLAHTITVDHAGKILVLGIVGAVPRGPGLGEVFVIAAEERREHCVAFVRAVRRILDRARTRFAIIEAVAAEGVPDRWFKWLGFSPVARESGRWRLEGEKT
jgi:hypothetical protein